MKLDLQANYFKKAGGRKSKPPHRKFRRGKQLVYHGTVQIPTNSSTIYSQITNGSQPAAQSNPAPQSKPTTILVDPPSIPSTGIPPQHKPIDIPPPVTKGIPPPPVPKTEPPRATKTEPSAAEVQAFAGETELPTSGVRGAADLRKINEFSQSIGDKVAEKVQSLPPSSKPGFANLATGNVQPRSTPRIPGMVSYEAVKTYEENSNALDAKSPASYTLTGQTLPSGSTY